MPTYKTSDGFEIKTEKADQSWDEDPHYNGTGAVGHHQRLHKSKNGRYYMEHWSDYQTSGYVRWLDNRDAAVWLKINNHNIPDDLLEIAKEIVLNGVSHV